MQPFTVDGLAVKGSVFIVTHGEKFSGPDPRLTPNGMDQARDLRGLLPEDPAECICGTGRRHRQMATNLSLTGCSFNPVVGLPDSLEHSPLGDVIVLADGFQIPREAYNTIGLKEALLTLLNSLPANSVVCGGRPTLLRLGVKEAESAAVYRIDGNTITKVAAYGETGGQEQV